MEITMGSFSLSVNSVFLWLFIGMLFYVAIKFKARRNKNKDKNPVYYRDSIGRITEKGTIAVVDIFGPILHDPKAVSPFARPFVCFGAETERLLDELAKNPSVVGVIARFETPGGTINGSQAIFDGLARCAAKKLVFAHVLGLSASGGVWSMIGANKIYAEAGAIVGSIGILGPTLLHFTDVTSFGTGLLGQDVTAKKIEATVFAKGRGKALGNPFALFDEETIRSFDDLLAEVYENFLSHVAAHRNIDKETLRAAGARLFHPKEAMWLGLIDGIANRRGVEKLIAEDLGLDAEKCRFVKVLQKEKTGYLSMVIGESLQGIVKTGNPHAHIIDTLKAMPVLALSQHYLLGHAY